MTGFDFRSVTKAPKGAAKGKCLPAPKLAYELAVAVLRLSLDPARPPIHRPTVQAVSPVLDAAYQQPQSTIPTYLGAGRSADGLGLYRPKAGPYPVCLENAALALKRLEQLGHSPARIAALLGVPSETELLAALAALPDYDAAVAASLAAPRPSSRPAADAGDAAGSVSERKETAKEAKERAKDENERRVRQEAAEVEALYRPKAEQDEQEMNDLMSQVDDDEQ